jgi:N-acyl-D-amino-acid deacylase
VTFDLIVRNGTVVDGSGLPRYRADVGICDGRIAVIGRIRDRGAREIDAEGHFVTPGFIDVHTHLDVQVYWDPLGTSACWHGVTSAIMGNCGFTVAPCDPAKKDLALRSVERAEDIARADVMAGVDWSWETFGQYLDAVEAQPKGINYGAYVGHSALRAYVMGERAFEAEATEEDVSAMCRELDRSLRAGAVGFSTSRSIGHLTVDGHPVASRLASWTELDALVDVLGNLGTGIFQIANEISRQDELRAAYFARLRDLSVRTGRTVSLPLLFLANRPELSEHLETLIFDTAAAGGRMIGQVGCREQLSIIGFPTKLPFDQLSSWRQLRAKPLGQQRAELLDPDLRARLVQEAEHGRYADGFGTEMRPPRYELLRVLDRRDGPYRTVADVAAERGCSPVDALIDLSLEAGLERFFAQPFANEALDRVLALLRNPRTVVAGSDTGAHVSQISDSSIPTFLLSHWVRREEAFTWEEGVRMLTATPAHLWDLPDRGMIEEGRWADLVIFDPDQIGPELPTADNDLPAGGVRLKQRASGILATVVNGDILMYRGEHTGAHPGRVLRRSVAGKPARKGYDETSRSWMQSGRS